MSYNSIREIALLYAANKNGLLAISEIIFKRMIFIGEVYVEWSFMTVSQKIIILLYKTRQANNKIKPTGDGNLIFIKYLIMLISTQSHVGIL